MQCGHSSHSTAPRHGVKTKIFLELGFKAAAAQVEKPVPSQHAAEKVPCFLSNCGSTAQFVLGRGQRRYTQLTHQSPPTTQDRYGTPALQRFLKWTVPDVITLHRQEQSTSGLWGERSFLENRRVRQV